MSSSTLLNPATGKLFAQYLPTGISIPTDQLTSPTTLGTSVDIADDGVGGLLVVSNVSLTSSALAVGDTPVYGSAKLRQQSLEFQQVSTGTTYPVIQFEAGGTATLSNIRLLNGLPLASTAAVAEVVAPRTWASAGIPVLNQNVPTSARTGQNILLEVSANLRLSPTAPFVGEDVSLTLALTGVPGVVVVPPVVPAFSSLLNLQYLDGAIQTQTFPITFSVIVSSTGTSAWSLFLTASSPLHSYGAIFQDAVLLKATTLAN